MLPRIVPIRPRGRKRRSATHSEKRRSGVGSEGIVSPLRGRAPCAPRWADRDNPRQCRYLLLDIRTLKHLAADLGGLITPT